MLTSPASVHRAALAIRPGQPTDLMACARIYRDSFPEALTSLFGHARIDPTAIESVFHAVYNYEPGGFWVAEKEGRIAGFAVVVSDIQKFGRQSQWIGFFLKSLWKGITGAYQGISRRSLWNLAALGWRYRHSSPPEKRKDPRGRFLWAAVDPAYRDGVLGARLILAAEAYLRKQGVASIRVEVNLPKTSIIAFYKHQGYMPLGQVNFLWGPALVLEKKIL